MDERAIPELPTHVATLAAELTSPSARPAAPRLPLSRDNPERIGRLTWQFIGYEEYRLAWNAACDLTKHSMLMRLACNRVLERVESAVESYIERDSEAPLNVYYVQGLNAFLRQWWETWALCSDESEGEEDWYIPIGPPWEEFEYEYVPSGWRVANEVACDACNTIIRQNDPFVLAQDMVQEGWFCSMECAQWHRRQLFERAPQLAPFLLDPCPLLRPLPKTRDDMLAYWLTLPKMLAHDWNPDPMDYKAAQPGLKPRPASKVKRIPRSFTVEKEP